MDGIHDLGGKQGYGAVDRTEHEVFDHRWQASVFTIIRGLLRDGVAHNVDHFRHAIERIDPVAYLSHGYYGRWLGAAENLLVEAGVLTVEEIDKGAQRLGASVDERVAARPADKPENFEGQARMPSARRPDSSTPGFSPGDQVRCHATPSIGHTRLPAYARGKVGIIVSQHQSWVLPDDNAHGGSPDGVHLYTVEFSAAEMWGSEEASSVLIDLFEPYFELA